MTSAKEQERLFSSQFDNSDINAGAGVEITYHFRESGIDSATDIYFGFGRPAYGVEIRPSAILTLTKRNSKSLKDAITIATTGFIMQGVEFDTLTLLTGDAANIKVMAR